MERLMCYAYAEDEPSRSVIRRIVAYQNAASKGGVLLGPDCTSHTPVLDLQSSDFRELTSIARLKDQAIESRP